MVSTGTTYLCAGWMRPGKWTIDIQYIYILLYIIMSYNVLHFLYHNMIIKLWTKASLFHQDFSKHGCIIHLTANNLFASSAQCMAEGQGRDPVLRGFPPWIKLKLASRICIYKMCTIAINSWDNSNILRLEIPLAMMGERAKKKNICKQMDQTSHKLPLVTQVPNTT